MYMYMLLAYVLYKVCVCERAGQSVFLDYVQLRALGRADLYRVRRAYSPFTTHPTPTLERAQWIQLLARGQKKPAKLQCETAQHVSPTPPQAVSLAPVRAKNLVSARTEKKTV